MLGRSCQRETEERQKERVGQMVRWVGRTDSSVPTLLSKRRCQLVSHLDRRYQPRAVVSIPQERKPGSIPKRRNVDPRPLLPSSVEQWEA